MRLQSRRVRAAEFMQPWFLHRTMELGYVHMMHRKLWEHCAITAAFEHARSGYCALGFGVGTEATPAWLASRGAIVMATDSPSVGAWGNHSQHAAGLAALNRANCDPKLFERRVSFMAVDMNRIPEEYANEFDFTWSSSCMEHLGGIEQGIQFFLNQMKCLRWGGVAAHTTEFVYNSNDSTVDTPNLCLFRRCDFEELSRRMAEQGDTLLPIDLERGTEPADLYVDREPYDRGMHLNLAMGRYEFTSVLLIGVRGNA